MIGQRQRCCASPGTLACDNQQNPAWAARQKAEAPPTVRAGEEAPTAGACPADRRRRAEPWGLTEIALKQARLIVSLDCEGKWGMADRITPHHDRCFTRENLLGAYRAIVDLFDRHDVTATFAFVGAFVASPGKVRALLREVPTGRFASRWFARVRQDLERGALEGWFLPEALELVRARGRHEIAGHGFTHLPFAEGQMSAAWADRELHELRDHFRGLGLRLRTLIYPRNVVGHLGLLPRHDLIGYREHPPRRPWPVHLAGWLGRQVGPLRASAWPGTATPQPIPTAHFVNWRHGLRALVPKAHVVARFCRLIDDAVARGGIAHFYLHPHNLIDGGDQLEMLDGILAHYAACHRRGEIACMTQQQFCEQLRAANLDREDAGGQPDTAPRLRA